VRSGLDDKIAGCALLYISRRRRYLRNLRALLSTRCRHEGGQKVLVGGFGLSLYFLHPLSHDVTFFFPKKNKKINFIILRNFFSSENSTLVKICDYRNFMISFRCRAWSSMKIENAKFARMYIIIK